MKIEIITRSMNYKLYRLSQSTIALPYKRKRCLFTSADGYLYKCIIGSSADVIINIDEDAFITDNQRLKNLIEFVIDNDYINCGMPDGGVVDIRKFNPLVTNPFFNIINVSKIRKHFNRKEILSQYSTHRVEFEKYTPNHLLREKYEYGFYEPYVPFFIWLSTNYKTLWLDAKVHSDGLSTILLDNKGEPFLSHSWYSRFYGTDLYHTKRIDLLYKEINNVKLDKNNNIKNQLIQLRDKIGNKYYYPIKNRFEIKLNKLCSQ